VPECQKLKNGGLDLYGPGPFEQQRFAIAGVEGVKSDEFWPQYFKQCNVY